MWNLWTYDGQLSFCCKFWFLLCKLNWQVVLCRTPAGGSRHVIQSSNLRFLIPITREFHDCFYCLFWFWYFIHIVQGTDVLIHALLSFDCYLLCHSNKIKNVSASFWLIWNWFDHCELLSDSHIITSWCTAKMCRLARSWVCAIQVALSSHRSLSPCWRSVIEAMTRRSCDLVHSLNHG